MQQRIANAVNVSGKCVTLLKSHQQFTGVVPADITPCFRTVSDNHGDAKGRLQSNEVVPCCRETKHP